MFHGVGSQRRRQEGGPITRQRVGHDEGAGVRALRVKELDGQPAEVVAVAGHQASLLLGGVLEMFLGRLAQVRALLAFYGRDRVRAFFRDGGLRRVDARTAAFWLLVLGLRRDECEPKSSPPPNTTFWPG